MKLKEIVEKIAPEYGLDPDLVLAVIQIESGGKTWATRYEPHWKWFKDVPKWAKELSQSEETERVAQATSYGLMQVMGAVCREMNFRGYLTQVCITEVGIRCGCMKLQSLFKKYEVQDDAIAAYNQGDNRKSPVGKYMNQSYVDKINAALKVIKAN